MGSYKVSVIHYMHIECVANSIHAHSLKERDRLILNQNVR